MRIRWSRKALDDLKDQIAFIAKDNPQAARKVAEQIRATGQLIAARPVGRKGRVFGTWEKSVKGLPYVVAYCLTAPHGEQTLVILRVIHTARRWPNETWPD
jgi:plasmid stabilization system protein ParE